jgi:MFS family permease
MSRLTFFTENPAFTKFLLARFVSCSGDVLMLTGIALHIKSLTNSPTALAYLLVAQSAPRLLGLLFGAIADRVERRKLMILCDLLQALTYGVMVLNVNNAFVIIACAAIASVVTTLWAPAGSGIIPNLITRREELPRANAVLSGMGNGVNALGPVIAAAVFTSFGIVGVVVANTISFVISALLVLAIRQKLWVASSEQHLGRMVLEGLKFSYWHLPSRAVAIGLLMLVFFGATSGLGAQFLIRDDLGATPIEFGFVITCYGIGMILGSASVVSLLRQTHYSRLLVLGIVVMGIGSLVIGFAQSILVVAFAFLVSGFGNGLENVGNDTALQTTVPNELQGRIFGIVFSFAFLSETFAGVVGGPLLNLLSPRVVYFIAGIGLLATSLVVWNMMRQHFGAKLSES